MESDEEIGNAFAIPDLWKSSKFAESALDDPNLISVRLDKFDLLGNVYTYLPPLKDSALEFTDPFHIGALETIDVPGESVESSDVGQDETPSIQEEDVWRFQSLDAPQENDGIYRSWDTFSDTISKEPPSAYISERGTQAFDAALKLQANANLCGNAPSNAVQLHALATSLLHLAQGNSSVLFRYDEATKAFHPTLAQMAVPGYSVQIIQSITSQFVEYGNRTRYLKAFVNKVYASRGSGSALVALADVVSTMLSALQARLSVYPTSIQSFLHLQSLLEHHGLILKCFEEIVLSVGRTESEEGLLTQLFETVHQREHLSPWLRQILLAMFARVSQPWLDFANMWIGVRNELHLCPTVEGKSTRFVVVETKMRIDEGGIERISADYVFDRIMVPEFISEEDARTIFETGKSLRLLQSHLPEHPLARLGATSNVVAPQLEWGFSLIDVERISAQANEYESNLAAVIKQYTINGHKPEKTSIGETIPSIETFDVFGKNEQEVKKYIAASTARLNQECPITATASENNFHNLVLLTALGSGGRDLDRATKSELPVSLASLLSFGPVLSAQARLVNSSCIRLFFKEHHLRSHLSLQRRFHLIGDGVFASRLSHALFDPNLEPAGRSQGTAYTGAALGLRLGSRENWPPASSELRLALMGILTDCYHSAPELDHHGSSRCRTRELPGGLSFAVRNISEQELQKSTDPYSIEALDFLRLQYKPPPPLEAIITPTCLYKYDQLFQFLLRVMRMLYVVNQFFRDIVTDRTPHGQGVDYMAQKFRIEAHHFVVNVSGYFFEVGVGVAWQKFEDKLDAIERRIGNNDAEGTLGDTEGLHKLQEYHERVLDRILFATLQRKRQEQVLKLLEDIFTLILTFARCFKSRVSGEKTPPEGVDEVRQTYAKFRKKVGNFINVCRSLSEKKGYGASKGAVFNDDQGLFGSEDLNEDGENSIGQLLIRLEMTRYYTADPL